MVLSHPEGVQCRVYSLRFGFVVGVLMSKKLIEFFSPFFYFSYIVIACFYAEKCTIYQILIL